MLGGLGWWFTKFQVSSPKEFLFQFLAYGQLPTRLAIDKSDRVNPFEFEVKILYTLRKFKTKTSCLIRRILSVHQAYHDLWPKKSMETVWLRQFFFAMAHPWDESFVYFPIHEFTLDFLW